MGARAEKFMNLLEELTARQMVFVDHQYVCTCTGRLIGRRQAGRTRTDDRDIGCDLSHALSSSVRMAARPC